jgi:deoxyhypusine synthase
VRKGSVSQFIDDNFRHFNAAVLKEAADAYIDHIDRGGKMMVALRRRDEHG